MHRGATGQWSEHFSVEKMWEVKVVPASVRKDNKQTFQRRLPNSLAITTPNHTAGELMVTTVSETVVEEQRSHE